MGPERLSTLFRRCALPLALSAASCGGARSAAPGPVAESQARPRHLQIVHAMTTPQRLALVHRLRERNPTTAETQWTVNEEALARSITVVDPFAGFLRRARRGVAERPARGAGPIGDADAASAARAFVKKNADVLGLPRHVVPALAEHVRRVEPADHGLPRATWVVRFDASFPSKGYESFGEIENHADVEVLVDDDGEVSSFVNLSRVFPRLTIDTKPGLAGDDPRLVAKLVGRRVFALEGSEPQPGTRLDELRRIPLGGVQATDVTRVQLVIHVATGPQLAWLTFRLAYFVEVAKPVPAEILGEEPGIAAPPQYFFFRYVVDADTGDVLEDARAPLSAPAALSP